jgi:hypothetical protein
MARRGNPNFVKGCKGGPGRPKGPVQHPTWLTKEQYKQLLAKLITLDATQLATRLQEQGVPMAEALIAKDLLFTLEQGEGGMALVEKVADRIYGKIPQPKEENIDHGDPTYTIRRLNGDIIELGASKKVDVIETPLEETDSLNSQIKE